MDSVRILVTGGSGFVGSHLIKELQSQGYTDIYATTFSSASMTLLDADHVITVDLTDTMATEGLIANLKPDWIFHLASFSFVGKSFERGRELLTNNIGLQINLLESVRQHSPNSRILTVGSAEEYGVVDTKYDVIDEQCPLNPVNPYAVSKVAQDLLAGSYFLSYRMNIVRARPFNHIGPGQVDEFVIPSFAKQIVAIERGEQQALQVGNLDAIRDFTSVTDMVRAYIVLMKSGETGQIYNIGSGFGRTIREVLSTLMEISSAAITLHTDTSRLRPLDVPRMVADNRKIRALGWEPTVPLEEELQRILEEWRHT